MKEQYQIFEILENGSLNSYKNPHSSLGDALEDLKSTLDYIKADNPNNKRQFTILTIYSTK